MSRLGRMPVWGSVDAIRRHWLTVLLIGDIAYGGVQMSNPGVVFWCGAVMVVSAVLVGLGWNVIGAGLATIVWSVLGFAGTDNPILLAEIGAFHGLIFYEVGTGLDEERELIARSVDGG